MTIYQPFFLGLLAAVALASFRKDARLNRCAWAVAGNWLANTIYCLASGSYDPWYWFVATDAAAAWIILMRPAAFFQGALGGFYLIQIMIHFGYAAALYTNEEMRVIYSDVRLFYWNVLTVIGWMQIGILFCWGAGHGGLRNQVSALRGFFRRRVAASSPHHPGDER